jgi:Phosphoesterase family
VSPGGIAVGAGGRIYVTTYPERPQRAGVSWQVYQEDDNYDDNALAWFRQYAHAPLSSPLRQGGMRKRAAGWFEQDAREGRLPQVSWLVGPTARPVGAPGLLPGRRRRVHRAMGECAAGYRRRPRRGRQIGPSGPPG